MRLIDADVMHREIDKYNPEGRMSLKNIKRYIDAQPTVYDIEDIVKQLEKEKERQRENAIDRNYRIGVVNGLNVSIGIVKGGAE